MKREFTAGIVEKEEMNEPVKVVLCLGSNDGDRRKALTDAIAWLGNILEDFEASAIYETPPYSGSGPLYLNVVVKGTYSMGEGVRELERMCKLYEYSHGRDEKARSANRVPVDIDIVLAEGKILRPSDYARSFFRIGFSQLSPE